MDNAPKEIELLVCPACGHWQRWPGTCDNLCVQDGVPVQVRPVTYRISEEK